jgi:hypothetical protein
MREFSPISLSQRDERVIIANSTNFFGLKHSVVVCLIEFAMMRKYSFMRDKCLIAVGM